MDSYTNRNYRGRYKQYGLYPRNWGQQNQQGRDYQRQNNFQSKRYQYPDQDQQNNQREQQQEIKQIQEMEQMRYRDILVITLEAMMVDVEDETEGVERTNTVIRSDAYCSKDGDKSWIKLNGKVDFGADSSVGSWQNHRQYCTNTWNLVGQRLRIRVGGGQILQVNKKGLVHLKVEDKVLDPCEILLAECLTWVNLLTGEGFLQTQGPSFFGSKDGTSN